MNVAVAFAFLQAILVMTLLGFFVIELLLPPRTLSRWLVWALAPAVGAGMCSFLVFLFRRPMFTVERGLLLVLFCLWVWKRRPPMPDFVQLREYRIPILEALFLGAVLVALIPSVVRVAHIPHGGTDGYLIWNSHARYLFRDPHGWQQNIHNTFHSDYPLLLPTLVMRAWRYSGDVPDLGGLMGLMFPFVAVAVLATAMAQLRGSGVGILMALILLTTPYYMVLGTHQEADIPLSAFILCTVALIYLYFEREAAPNGLLILAGFLAGSAAWTKNEGVLFLVATTIALVVPILWKPRVTLRRAGLFLAGALLPLAVLLYFKVTVAPESYLVQGRQLSDLITKIAALDRHVLIFRRLASTAWTFGQWMIHPIVPLAAFLIWRGFDRLEIGTFRWRIAAGIVLIVLTGYYWVYVITPIELGLHLESSLDRLLMHLWPAAIFLIGLVAKKSPPYGA